MNIYQQPFGFGQQMPAGFVGSPLFAQGQPTFPAGQPFIAQPVFPQAPPPGIQEESYIENILRLNLGKVATVYMNFENSQFGSKIFKGYVTAAGRDHIILKDVQSETRYILLMVYLLYITFDEDIEYEYPFRSNQKNS
ncbi:MAG: spore coat protein GerQ [Acholeplasmataceae bacterium]|nr:spore coat protein GerQ [Acholeplasmataceae bacterium]